MLGMLFKVIYYLLALLDFLQTKVRIGHRDMRRLIEMLPKGGDDHLPSFFCKTKILALGSKFLLFH